MVYYILLYVILLYYMILFYMILYYIIVYVHHIILYYRFFMIYFIAVLKYRAVYIYINSVLSLLFLFPNSLALTEGEPQAFGELSAGRGLALRLRGENGLVNM